MLELDLKTDIKFYKTEDCGRKAPTASTFFGCIFVIDGSNHDGRILLENIGPISPGDKKNNIPIKFLCPDLVIPKLKVGTKFYIRNGRIIGEGSVCEIINKNPKTQGE